MPRAAFITLGCKVNQYDTQLMRETLRKRGYEMAQEGESADLVVINTCTVTNVSDRKARQLIRKVIREQPHARVVVTGCYAENGREVLEQIPGVSLVLGNEAKPLIGEQLQQLGWTPLPESQPVEDTLAEHRRFGSGVQTFDGQTRAIVKVQDGCSAGCTYCIIPSVRGPIVSRPIPEIVEEVAQLAAHGYKEVVVTGVHLGAYGKDIRRTATLADVLEQIQPMDGIERIRLSSIEPMDVPPSLIERMAALSKCVPHFHLPIQSGSDAILHRMRRRYTAAKLTQLVSRLRDAFPDLGLTTDVMVGFPGETEAHFEETYALIETLEFSQLHVFRYSPREGTPAASYSEQVAPHLSAERSERLRNLGDRLVRQFQQQHVGEVMDVLIEDTREGDLQQLAGFTGNYLRVLTDATEPDANQILPVRLETVHEGRIQGRVDGMRTS